MEEISSLLSPWGVRKHVPVTAGESLWSVPFDYSTVHITVSSRQVILEFDKVFPKEILQWVLTSVKTMWTTESKLFCLWNPFFCFYQNVCSLSVLLRCFSSIQLCISNTVSQWKCKSMHCFYILYLLTKNWCFGFSCLFGSYFMPTSFLIHIPVLGRINNFLYLLGVTVKHYSRKEKKKITLTMNCIE